jgi:hypothetical protein
MASHFRRAQLSIAIATLLLLPILRHVTSAAQSQGSEPGDAITPDILRAHVTALAADAMEGRETGTRGFDRAAQYVSNVFRALELQQLTPDYLDAFRIRRGRVIEDGTSLVVTIDGKGHALRYGVDYVSYGSTSASLLDAEGRLIFVGSGVTVPSGSHDDYAGLDVRGAIVVANLQRTGLSDADAATSATLPARARNAAAHGAVGLLVIDADATPWDLRVRAARQVGASEGPLTSPLERRAPTFILNAKRAAELFGGVVQKGSRLGLATLRLRMTVNDVTAANVVAVLPGGDKDRRSEYVVYVAHLDHVGIGRPVRGDRIYNGAVDNASGVPTMLAIARAFARSSNRPKRSIVFLATSGEEQGELGSDYFVRHGPLESSHLVAALNIDGASIVPFDEATVGGGASSTLGTHAEEAARRLGIRVVLEPLDAEGSDYAPFLRAGIPSLWIQAALPAGWMDTRYHTPQDDLGQPLDFGAMARYARLNFWTGLLAADANERPHRP